MTEFLVSGGLKNLIDWLSRSLNDAGEFDVTPDGHAPLSGKVVGICGLHPNPSGPSTARGQLALRQALIFPNAVVLGGPAVTIPGGLSAFEQDKSTGAPILDLRKDSAPRGQMVRLITELIGAARRQGRVGRKDGMVTI